jgi:hypothetical protein
MKRQVKEAKILEQHIVYLCKKNEWEQPTFEMIAWEPHRRAINRHSKNKTIMVKYLNDIAPVGRVVSRYDKKYPAKCPSCEEPCETQEHLHQCQHPTQQQWRENFHKKMQQTMEKYETPEPMAKLWLEGLRKGMMNDNNTIKSSPDLRHSIEAQEKIWWDQMMKGRIAHQWVQTQKEAMGDTATKKKNALTWATDMVALIFEQWLQLWKIRNEDRHGRDRATRRTA